LGREEIPGYLSAVVKGEAGALLKLNRSAEPKAGPRRKLIIKNRNQVERVERIKYGNWKRFLNSTWQGAADTIALNVPRLNDVGWSVLAEANVP